MNTSMRFLFLAVLLAGGLLKAQPGQISLQNFSTGFSAPLDLTHAGDDRIFVVEKAGRIIIVDQAGVKNPTPYLNIVSKVSSAASERGLLGLAFHPDYQQNGYFYVNYTTVASGPLLAGTTVIARYNVSASDPDLADPLSELILLTVPQPFSNHNGGCIKFGPDGYLYIGMGDGGSGGDPGNRSQNPMELLGKMLRLDVDIPPPYVPASNPYVGNPSYREEIWGMGLRNPWRFSFDRVLDDLWIGDVGQNAWEEIDYWAATNPLYPNFGWRCYEGTVAFNTTGCQPQSFYDAPIYTFVNGSGNCSVTGGFVYRGARFASFWGYYFHTDYCSGKMWYTVPNGTGGWNTANTAVLSANNLVGFGEDVYGELYVCGISTGIVYRLRDTTCTPMAYIPGDDTLYFCQPGGDLEAFGGPSLGYQWQLNGSNIAGATSSDYYATVTGNYTVIVSNGGCSMTSAVKYVEILPPPTLSVTGLSPTYCVGDPVVTMTGSPTGGTFSGPGVSGNTFDPTAAGAGTHDIIYSYTDPLGGCEAEDTTSVDVSVCPAVNPPMSLREMKIYPNPSTGRFKLEVSASWPSDMLIQVSDIRGRLVHNGLVWSDAGLSQTELDLSNLNSGVYFVQVRAGASVLVQKLVLNSNIR